MQDAGDAFGLTLDIVRFSNATLPYSWVHAVPHAQQRSAYYATRRVPDATCRVHYCCSTTLRLDGSGFQLGPQRMRLVANAVPAGSLTATILLVDARTVPV